MATRIVGRQIMGSIVMSHTSPIVNVKCVRAAKPFTTSLTTQRRKGFQSIQASAVEAPPRDQVLTSDPNNNVSENIYSKIGVNLHKTPGHPLYIIKSAIIDFFDKVHADSFKSFDDLNPIVTTEANFDSVLVPADHVSRSPNDTYYISADKVLRCHTSAHQAELLRQGEKCFLVTGDVYRRDSIDKTHYPVFHQMEGFRVFTPEEVAASGMSGTELASTELKKTLEGLAKHLFGDVECRWIDAYFPFTDPSYELEIFFNGEWLEVLGCGVTEQQILRDNGNEGNVSWAFGLGLERLAMVLFEIPDIRLFWTADKRFTSQFADGKLDVKFKPFSKYPPVFKDMAFWVSEDFTENNLAEIVRNAGGDLVEEVKLIDEFTNKKTGRTSNCFRITYRSMERSLTDEEINAIQDTVRSEVAGKLGVELR